jgi:hypothetical protein
MSLSSTTPQAGRLTAKLDGSAALHAQTVVTVSNPATANAYGSWAQIVAATSEDSLLTSVTFAPATSGSPNTYQLGIGAAGSEVAILECPILPFDKVGPITINFKVPAGSRLAARSKSTQATVHNAYVGVSMYPLSGIRYT